VQVTEDSVVIHSGMSKMLLYTWWSTKTTVGVYFW